VKVKVNLVKDEGKTNNFEIVWNGHLLHSKSTARDEGFPTLDKLNTIIAEVLAAMPAETASPVPAQDSATPQVFLTQAQASQLGANPKQAEALLRRGFARPQGLVRFAATHGLEIGARGTPSDHRQPL